MTKKEHLGFEIDIEKTFIHKRLMLKELRGFKTKEDASMFWKEINNELALLTQKEDKVK